ncbi:EF-P beta-lysylation protein EpmB [Reinekea blandensis]|uniref:L-lysine 2,3-aminomutase n=1 Tax=Reinekea blandensis MED297 TaxID=314283 RepID=A4BE53_9GAMM|nr:EF-P beta-lysylation protein EpmB [Reinekea blandensis]EAR09531.1 radical SAM domain protein [Reinekea blandensis MED297]
MIPVSATTLDTSDQIASTKDSQHWQKSIAKGFRTPSELLDYLNLKTSELPYQIDPNSPFRMRITRHLASLMEKGNPFDPLLLQLIPRLDETTEQPGYQTDPLMEEDYQVIPGLIHKYQNRVLIIAHQACAIHCRYCFRRHFPYSEARLSESSLDAIEQYIQSHSDIDEVIFSGGDPLSLADEALSNLIQRFDRLPQIQTVRLHTRTPVAAPERITETLLNTLNNLSCQVVMVVHINHPNELHPDLLAKFLRLRDINVTLLNQSVLLRGINDCSKTQIRLCKQLFAHGVLPYYLHSLDPVQGTSHFDVNQQTAGQIWLEMQAGLSGYLLPRLVREIPQRHSKTWIHP